MSELDAGDAATLEGLHNAIRAQTARRMTEGATVNEEQIAQDRRTELAEWWLKKAHGEVSGLLDKMTEYGGRGAAIDLIEIGRVLADIGGQDFGDAQHAELGIYFYVLGKMSRWTAAVMEGRQVSDDTLHDIGIYIRMAQRIRDVGGWPVP